MIKKLLLLAVLLVVGVIALLIIGGGLLIDRAAKAAVQTGGTYALGVDTTVNSVNVGLFSGTLTMDGLRVANPSGFKSDRFFGLSSGKVAVTPATLNKAVIELPELSLAGIQVNLERAGGKSNYQVILDNLKKLEGTGGEKKQPPADAKSEKKFVIKTLDIRDVKVHVDMLPEGGSLTQVNLPIEEVKLSNVGTASNGLAMDQIASIIIKAILNATAANGEGIIPGDLLGDLKGQLAQLQSLDQLGVQLQSKLSGETAKIIGSAQDSVQKAADEAQKKAQEELDKAKDKAKDAIGDLLGGKPKKGG